MDIFEAISKNKIKRIKELLSSGIDVNTKNEYENTFLHIACLNNNIEIVKLLLTHPKIDVNSKNKDGQTPLYVACYDNNVEIVKLLLTHPKIDVNIQDRDTPLYIACGSNRIEVVKLLLSRPDIKIDFDYNELKNTPKIRSLLKSSIFKYSITPILNSIGE